MTKALWPVVCNSYLKLHVAIRLRHQKHASEIVRFEHHYVSWCIACHDVDRGHVQALLTGRAPANLTKQTVSQEKSRTAAAEVTFTLPQENTCMHYQQVYCVCCRMAPQKHMCTKLASAAAAGLLSFIRFHVYKAVTFSLVNSHQATLGSANSLMHAPGVG